MRRSKVDSFIAVAAIGSILAMMWALNERNARDARESRTVPSATPTPAAVVPTAEPTTCPTAQAPQHNQKTEVLPVRMAEPLMFECPDGGILVPWNINWDAEPHECLRKLWALRSREGALHPLYSRYRRERCHAAWVACPERFRR